MDIREIVSAVRERLAELGPSGEPVEEFIRREVRSILGRDDPVVEKDVLCRLLGLGPIEALLADPEVSEIMVNGPHQIYVERNGTIELTDLFYTDSEELMNVVYRIMQYCGRRINFSSPLEDARLPDGSRVNAVVPPVTDYPVLTIRKFVRKVFKTGDLLQQGCISPDMVWFFDAVVKGKANIVVCGATSSGKTTFLRWFTTFLPKTERIITIEDMRELNLDHPHCVAMEATDKADIYRLTINALRVDGKFWRLPDLASSGPERAKEKASAFLGEKPKWRNHVTPVLAESLAAELLTRDQHRNAFENRGAARFALSVPGLSRFRVSVFRQRGCPAISVRVLGRGVPDLDAFFEPLPEAREALLKLAEAREGLIVVAGPAGSGKTATLAALVDRINRTRALHVVTVEDPIEYLHSHALSVVDQREVGEDAESVAAGVASAVAAGADVAIGSREAPGAKVWRETFRRKLAGKAFNLLVRLATGLPYRDTQCGFKLFRRTAAEALFSLAECRGYCFDVEVLLLARRFNFVVKEVGIEWHDRSGSKVRLLRDGWRMLRELREIRSSLTAASSAATAGTAVPGGGPFPGPPGAT